MDPFSPICDAVDLYPGKEFIWAYTNIPDADCSMDLQMAPRFDLNVYDKGACGVNGNIGGTTVGHRKSAYDKLYNITTLDDSWWGRKSLKRDEMIRSL